MCPAKKIIFDQTKAIKSEKNPILNYCKTILIRKLFKKISPSLVTHVEFFYIARLFNK